jgi:hypothetical protein
MTDELVECPRCGADSRSPDDDHPYVPPKDDPGSGRRPRPGWMLYCTPAGVVERRLRWRALAYLDGPLARRTALLGFLTDEQVPARLTATAAAPVRYELAGGGYRFTGEGYWPGDEPEEEPPLDDELPAADAPSF